jgi:hypothetical protein
MPWAHEGGGPGPRAYVRGAVPDRAGNGLRLGWAHFGRAGPPGVEGEDHQ